MTVIVVIHLAGGSDPAVDRGAVDARPAREPEHCAPARRGAARLGRHDGADDDARLAGLRGARSDPLTLGLMGLAEFVPAVILAMPAGHLADRFDRRRVVALAQAPGMAVARSLLALDAAIGTPRCGRCTSLAAVLGVATSFSAPAYTPLIAAAVPPSRSRARRRRSARSRGRPRASPGRRSPAGSQLIGDPAPYIGAPRPLPGRRCSCCWCRARSVARTTTSETRHADAARCVRRHPARSRLSPALLGAISLDLVAVLFGGVAALVPVFASDVLHVGAVGNGLLRARSGCRRGRWSGSCSDDPAGAAAGRPHAVRGRRRSTAC